MGKSRCKKLKNKPIPAVIPNLKCREDDLKDGKIQSSTESAVNSLLDQLQVPDSEENLCGLRRLSELFFDDDKTVTDDPNQTINRELHEKFIKTVAPFLVDGRPDIRNAAAGALRNVSVAGGPDICDVMVSNDIMTPLIALIQQYATDQMIVSTNEELSEEQKLTNKEKFDTLLQAVHLLWNLCESNETAVKYFNSSNLLGVLLKFMDIAFGGIDLTVVIAQCLHTVSDDNKVVLSTLQNWEGDIVKLIMIQNDEPSYIHLRTLAAGLLYNIHGCVPVKYLNIIVEILFKVIAIDSRNELCNLSSEVPLDKEAMLSSDAVTKLEKLLIIIDAQITAFEILTNICSDEEDDSMETESWNDSDEVDDDDTDCINPEDNNCSQLSYPSSVNSHVHEALVKLPFLQNSFNKTNLPSNVIDILTNHTDTRSVVKKFQRLRSRAYHFLNNLITALDVDDLDSPDNLFKMWSEIGRTIINGYGDTEIVEASTASLRAVLKKLVSIQYSGLSQMTSSDLEVIFKIVEHCKDNNVCANVVQVVAALGVFCASRNLDSLLKDIGKFILGIAEHQGPLWLTAEALDALMDVFAEDNTDKVTEEIALVSRLSVVAPVFKRKVRAERKTLGDHYALITTANNNLARFIAYKKNSLRCMQNGSAK